MSGHVPRLDELPEGDRRVVLERLKAAARLCQAEHREVEAALAHGTFVAEPDSVSDVVELLLVVTSDNEFDAGDYEAYFQDLAVRVELTVLERDDFRERAARGDPSLSAVRDRAVLLVGALPLTVGNAW